jgi:hypothetical protein
LFLGGLDEKSSSPFLYFLTLDRSRLDRILHPGFNLSEIKNKAPQSDFISSPDRFNLSEIKIRQIGWKRAKTKYFLSINIF